MVNKQYLCLNYSILPCFKKESINILSWADLTEEQILFVKNYFKSEIFNLLTIDIVSKVGSIPFLRSKNLNLIVEFLNSKNKIDFSIIQFSFDLNRLITIPGKDDCKTYIFIEEIVKGNLFDILKTNKIKSSCLFRIIRSLDYEVNENNNNILKEVKNLINKFKKNGIIRIEIEFGASHKIERVLARFLKRKVIYRINGYLDLSFFIGFSNKNWASNLVFDKKHANYPSIDFKNDKDMFKVISEKDCMVYHPFDDFKIFIDFLEQAANDKNVICIKQTLYRIGSDSQIIETLTKAANNGKKVLVFVELRARFDEKNNVLWSKKLEEAGCKVIYGVPGLKIHCKITVIIRKEGEFIRRYVHLGTGNYNNKTTKFYTDIGLFTSKNKITTDASLLLDSLAYENEIKSFYKLIVSPYKMRCFLEKMISNEIKNAKQKIKSEIIIKVNSISDKKLINLLYKASFFGVKITLIIRGICCLIPGIKNLSENIEVISIIGRFLEHSRIFYFKNNNIPKFFLGSADMMKRNLNKRIEVIFPIEDENLKNRISKIIKTIIMDNVNSYRQNYKSKYVKSNCKNFKKEINSQLKFFKDDIFC